MSSQNRGASYPVVALDEAISKLRIVSEKVGKGPSTKEEYIKGLGYKGESGASSRMFAAMVHYSLFEKVGDKYKFSDLALAILYPRNGTEPEKGSLQEAALSPKLFRQLYDRYLDQQLPSLLANTLIIDFQINDKSAKDAASNFRQSLDTAGLLRGGMVSRSINEQDDDAGVEMPELLTSSGFDTKLKQIETLADDMNKIEIVLRPGVKAGIYAPYDLTDAEKEKLKTLIGLL